MKILNIASGKSKPIGFKHENYFLVNLDLSNYDNTDIETVLTNMRRWEIGNEVYYVKEDVFKFLSNFTEKFNLITCYRFLEHVGFENVLGFIYLMSTSLESGGTVDIVVPNYYKLAQMIINEDVNSPNFEKDNILLTTELVNFREEPHASIWTVDRLKYFFEYEERFVVDSVVDDYTFDGRDIYLRMIAFKK